MRNLLMAIVLVAALLGAIGLGATHSGAAFAAAASHTHLLAGGGGPNDPVCPGAGSTGCG